MITISRNQNFQEWLNIKVLGKLVDNVRSKSRAMHLAYKIQAKHKEQTGESLTIVNNS